MNRDTQPYQEATIEIDQVSFDKHGMLFFDGLVNDSYVKVELFDMNEILPKVEGEFEYMDEDGLCNAVTDNYNNLHWLIRQSGKVVYKVVRLKPIMEKYLYESYIQK